MFNTYNEVIKNGEWLEDNNNATHAQFSRYATEHEESVWVCHECCSIVDDIDEHECE